MATKTIVCPECQAPAAAGRYACAQCGALLASVGPVQRAPAPSPAAAPVVVSAPDEAGASLSADGVWTEPHTRSRSRKKGSAPAWTRSLAAEPEDADPRLARLDRDQRWDDEPPAAVGSTNLPQGEPAATPGSVVAKAPRVSRATKAVTAPVSPVPFTADPEALERIAPLAGLRDVDDVPPAGVLLDGELVDEEPAYEVPEPEPFEEAVRGWPPPGDRGLWAQQAPRVPAGVYLPPSAVLTPSEAAPTQVAMNGRTAEASATASTRITLVERLAQLGLPADTPRRVVAVGAVVGALGFLLPWASVLAGSGLLGDYWAQWGMAGPGHWIVVAVLVGLAALSVAGGRLARLPVGLPGVILATLLAGLAWPYIFGFLGRSVGIWVVLGGAMLLLVGGLLDMRAGRHAEPGPTV